MNRDNQASVEMDKRIIELEMRMSFQDDLIQTLSDQIARQEMDMRRLWEANRHLHKQLEQMNPGTVKAEADETPPPHY